MRYLPLFCLLLATLAWGQEKTPQPTVPPEYLPPITRDNDEQQALPATASAVPSDAAVLTIEGLCDQAAPSTASTSSPSCRTIITRAQFEKLTNAILTNMKPSMQRQ